jgi:hypothetical protein
MVDLSISIVPSQNRLEAECHRLSEFRESLTNFSELPALIEKAKECMGISTTSSAFSNDVLRVEISGPTQQHLTIVDLPGLIHSENKFQSSADVALVLSIVQSYMANRRSIKLPPQAIGGLCLLFRLYVCDWVIVKGNRSFVCMFSIALNGLYNHLECW